MFTVWPVFRQVGRARPWDVVVLLSIMDLRRHQTAVSGRREALPMTCTHRVRHERDPEQNTLQLTCQRCGDTVLVSIPSDPHLPDPWNGGYAGP